MYTRFFLLEVHNQVQRQQQRKKSKVTLTPLSTVLDFDSYCFKSKAITIIIQYLTIPKR